MYKCSVCAAVSAPRQPQLRHVVTRHVLHAHVVDGKRTSTTRTEIAAELPVCHACYKLLELGIPLKMLIKQRGTQAAPVRKVQAPCNAVRRTNPNYGGPLMPDELGDLVDDQSAVA